MGDLFSPLCLSVLMDYFMVSMMGIQKPSLFFENEKSEKERHHGMRTGKKQSSSSKKQRQLRMKERTALTSGMGEFSPGIFRLGYDGGGPYRCMAISHGGGTLWAFCRKKRTRCHLPDPLCLPSTPILTVR